MMILPPPTKLATDIGNLIRIKPAKVPTRISEKEMVETEARLALTWLRNKSTTRPRARGKVRAHV